MDELVRHPKVLDAVESVIGPNILIYHPKSGRWEIACLRRIGGTVGRWTDLCRRFCLTLRVNNPW
jgi:hypothetical protein